MRTPLAVLLLAALGLTASCSSGDGGRDCADARAVAKKHKAAAETALAEAVRVEQDADPSTVFTEDPGEFLKNTALLDRSAVGTTETRVYVAVVKGNQACFGAEERAQVDVLSGTTR